MKIKTFKGEYELVELNMYIDNSYEKSISVLELLVKTDDVDNIKDESFIIEKEKLTYIFSGYEIAEYYMINSNLVQVVYIKQD